MNSEEYIYKKLDNLSPLDKALSEEMVKNLGGMDNNRHCIKIF